VIDTPLDIEASLAMMERDQGCLLLGVPAMKGLEDLHRYERVIEATQPGLIIQTGTAVGGSAMWFARSWISYAGPHVVTIDIDGERIHPDVRTAARITVLEGSSTDPGVIASVRSLASGYDKIMAVLDSDHSSAHVREEIGLYGPLVTAGCYLVVEDGLYDFAPDGPFYPGPLDAIQACLANDDRFERDTAIEALERVSMYPAGWWRKK
jgi:cephalosporin hydroxylase